MTYEFERKGIEFEMTYGLNDDGYPFIGDLWGRSAQTNGLAQEVPEWLWCLIADDAVMDRLQDQLGQAAADLQDRPYEDQHDAERQERAS